MASERCKKHPAESVSSVCLTHCQLTCIKCVLEDHRDCSAVTSLTDAIGSVREKIYHCLHRSRVAQAMVYKRSAESQQILNEIDAVQCQIETEIISMYSKLQTRIDDLKTASLDELRSIVERKKHDPKNTIEHLVAIRNTLDKSVMGLERKSTADISDKNLSLIKLSEESLREIEKSKYIRTKPEQQPLSMEFTSAPLLENILTSNLSKLGLIHCGEEDVAADFSTSVNISSDVEHDVEYGNTTSATASADVLSSSTEVTDDDFECKTFTFSKNISYIRGFI